MELVENRRAELLEIRHAYFVARIEKNEKRIEELKICTSRVSTAKFLLIMELVENGRADLLEIRHAYFVHQEKVILAVDENFTLPH